MKNLITKPFLTLMLFLVVLWLLIFLVGNEKIFLFVNQQIAHPVLDFIVLKILMPLFLLLGAVPFFMLFLKKYRGRGAFALFSGPFCYIAGSLIKLLFKMPRPLESLSARIIGPSHVSQYSFPSTTTMLAFGLALPFLIEGKSRWRTFSLILAILVGFSVIYTGYHLPQDVLAGVFFALLLVSLLAEIKKRILK